MDDKVIEQIEGFARDLYTAQDHGLDRGDCSTLAERMVAAGYRLDPYPNAKSKGELIARIETVESERDKTRNLLRAEHVRMVLVVEGRIMAKHQTLNPTCPVCTFLAETSSVKP